MCASCSVGSSADSRRPRDDDGEESATEGEEVTAGAAVEVPFWSLKLSSTSLLVVI